jgi:predicted transcriptional regulator
MSTIIEKPLSSVLSVRVSASLKNQLEYLSRSTKRSKAYLTNEALSTYIHKNAWRAKEIHDAIKEADNGMFVTHEAMVTWADALGTRREYTLPKPVKIDRKT